MPDLTRRIVLGSMAVSPILLLLGARAAGAATPPAAPSPAPPSPAPHACAAEDSDGMRGSLNYVETSQFGAERDCRNCEFWRAAEGAACGGCTLIDGLISPTGYCDSWALAAPAAQPGAPSSTRP